MTPFDLAFPFIISGLNRDWRGADGSPKWAWFLFMTIIAYVVSKDAVFSLIWFVILAGYAIPPTQDMFSTITNAPPGRKDSIAFQWQQDLALHLTGGGSWDRFSIIYGAIRSLWMLPGIIAMCYHTQSIIPCAGMILFGIGALYVWYKNVGLAERAFGWFLGLYLLLCASTVAPYLSFVS